MLRQRLTIAFGAMLLIGIGGCGSAPAQAGASASTGTSHAAKAPLRLASASVGGNPTKVLVSASGMTLYYFSRDTAARSACTGSCAVVWPPLLVKSGAISRPSGLSGTLSVVKDQNGSQVAYNGHLLYTYSADSKPGQANGEGVQGAWWVATPGLAAAASNSSSGSGAPGW